MAKSDNTGISGGRGDAGTGGTSRSGMGFDSGMVGRMGQQQAGMAASNAAYNNIMNGNFNMNSRGMSSLQSNIDAMRGNGATGGGGGSIMMPQSPYQQSFQQGYPQQQAQMPMQNQQIQQSPYQQMGAPVGQFNSSNIGYTARPQYQGETYNRNHAGIRQSSNPTQFGGQTRF